MNTKQAYFSSAWDILGDRLRRKRKIARCFIDINNMDEKYWRNRERIGYELGARDLKKLGIIHCLQHCFIILLLLKTLSELYGSKH